MRRGELRGTKQVCKREYAQVLYKREQFKSNAHVQLNMCCAGAEELPATRLQELQLELQLADAKQVLH